MENNKKLLLLGGSNCCEDFVKYAKSHNITLVASGKYKDTPLKRISKEVYDVDAIDDENLIKLVKEKNIGSVFIGCNEDVVPHAINVCDRAGISCYCSIKQWDICADKSKFKAMCKKNDIPVAMTYLLDDAENGRIKYPVVVKPADSCGSQGFCLCQNYEELKTAYKNALSFSRSGNVLIEEYIPYNAVIIHYTLVNSKIYFSGMSDKISAKIKDSNSSVMAFQSFPSVDTEKYLNTLNEKVCQMFLNEGFHDGPIWIEAFNNNGDFVFNEMGYRFGGSMTYYPIRYMYGFDQLQLILDYDINKKPDIDNAKELIKKDVPGGKKYAIVPLHLSTGKIESISGIDEILSIDNVYAFVPTHDVGDEIKNTGTVSQVFCYLHILYDNIEELKVTIKDILRTLKVYSTNGENILFSIVNYDEVTI